MLTNRKDGALTTISGRTRSGKTLSASQQVTDEKRLVVWDIQGDWLRFGLTRVTDLAELCRMIKASPRGPLRVTFKGTPGQNLFGQFCRVMMIAAQLEPLAVVVEELGWVTSSQKAPAGWHELVAGGLKYGVRIVAITNAPSESDKTSLRNSTVIRCFQMQRANDRKYMAEALDVPVDELAALKPLEYVESIPAGGTFKGTVIP